MECTELPLETEPDIVYEKDQYRPVSAWYTEYPP
jgi:hypothetical protein